MPVGSGGVSVVLTPRGIQSGHSQSGTASLSLSVSGTANINRFSESQRSIVSGSSQDHYVKFEIQDPDLNWKDVSTGLSTPDWLNSIQISDSVDLNTMSMTASLLRNDTPSGLSLAPLMEGSTINRDALNAYAPMLDLRRMWRVNVAVVADGGSPTGNYKEIGKGYLDTIQVNDVDPTIEIVGRGEEAIIIDHFVATETDYATTSTPIETVLQNILDAELTSAPTIYVPVPMNYEVIGITLEQGSLMASLSKIAGMAGAVLRYRYDEAGVNRLTLYKPEREAEAGQQDWSIASTEYLRIPLNQIDISGVRNRAIVRYVDETSGETLQITVNSTSSYSQTRYGIRPILIDLSEETQVVSQENATLLGEAVVSDLELPILEQRIETFGLWFVRLQDYAKTLANSVHYDVDQYGGVTGFTHKIENGHIRTSIDLGGAPRGGFRRWFPWGQKTSTMKPKPPTPLPEIPFPPQGTTGLLLDLDPASLVQTLSNGDITSYCPDVSGNGRHARQTNSARQPTLVTNGTTNGYPVLEFGGEDNLFTGDVLQPTDGTTLFLVLKRSGTFNAHGCFAGWLQTGGTTPADSPAILEQTSGNIEFFDTFPSGTGTDSHYSIIGSPSTNWCVVALVFASRTSGTTYYNGVAGSTFTPPGVIYGSGYNRFYIGAGNGSGIWYGANCRIARAKWYGNTTVNPITVSRELMTYYAIP